MPLHRHIDHVIELRIGGRGADHHGLEDFIKEFLPLGLDFLLLYFGEFAMSSTEEFPGLRCFGSIAVNRRCDNIFSRLHEIRIQKP